MMYTPGAGTVRIKSPRESLSAVATTLPLVFSSNAHTVPGIPKAIGPASKICPVMPALAEGVPATRTDTELGQAIYSAVMRISPRPAQPAASFPAKTRRFSRRTLIRRCNSWTEGGSTDSTLKPSFNAQPRSSTGTCLLTRVRTEKWCEPSARRRKSGSDGARPHTHQAGDVLIWESEEIVQKNCGALPRRQLVDSPPDILGGLDIPAAHIRHLRQLTFVERYVPALSPPKVHPHRESPPRGGCHATHASPSLQSPGEGLRGYVQSRVF